MVCLVNLCLLALPLCLLPARCVLYGAASPVVTLDANGFDAAVRTHGVSLVEFCTETSNPCTRFASDYETAATATKDVVRVYAVSDATLLGRYNVQSFPSFKVFLGRGPTEQPRVVDYTGPMNVSDLVTFTMKHLNKHVKAKVPAPRIPEPNTRPRGVVALNESDFNTKVLDDRYNQWLIMFFAPWCGHCQALEPEWRRMATIADNVNIGAVDATVNQALAQRYGVKGYPTIVLLPQGTKSPSKAIPYNGARKAEDILAFAKRHYRNLGPPAKVDAVIDLKQRCSGPLCLLFFLPEAEVNAHLETISKVMEKNSSLPFQFCYTLAGRHPQWERALGVSSFPSLLGLNLSKNVYSTMRKERLTFLLNTNFDSANGCCGSHLLPLNGGRGLVGDVVAHPVDLRNVLSDFARDGREALHVNVPGELGSDEVHGHDDADDNNHAVDPGRVPETSGTGVGKEHTGTLGDLVNKAPGLELLEHVAVRLPGNLDVLRDELAKHTGAEAGAGEGVPLEAGLGEPEDLAELPHLLLEEQAHGLNELELEVLGKPSDVVVGLDGQLAPPVEVGLEDVRVDGALEKKAVVVVEAELLHGPLELLNVHTADDLALLLGVNDTLELLEEDGRGLADGELDAGDLGLEPVEALLGLLVPHEAGVDHDAVEPLADGLVDNGRAHSAVDTAGETSDDELVAAALLDRVLLGLLKVAAHVPGLLAAADLEAELLHDVVGLATLDLLGVEAEAPDASLGVHNAGDAALGIPHGDGVAERDVIDFVKVAAVRNEFVASDDAVYVGLDVDALLPVLALLLSQGLDFAAQGSAQRVHGVCQGEHGHLVGGAYFEDLSVQLQGLRVADAFGPAAENHTSGDTGIEGLHSLLNGEELAGDAKPSEEADHGPRLVAAEVEYKNNVLFGLHC
ncbi:disulfide isomerase-related protein [Babesia caballi]|uniref:Disulfide isomerase-related protein n=1 Tax=Babesia caballi TaxID=5871 RepID=A0AAV4LTJ3_BABCB|nr:disulfide isomerase-related protein [Babesia caballi]